jgi:clan AA aspartic protease
MITGLVTAEREAIIALTVRGFGGQEEPIEAVIDTGFNGFLTLPPPLISGLALPFAGVTRAELGDGSEVDIDVFAATVLWDSHERAVLILGAEGGPLLGMSLLSGYRVTLEVKDGGAVMIEALP